MLHSVTVTVEDDRMDRIEDLADQLRAAGMQIQQVLGSVGIITGEVTDAQRPAIAQIPGVVSVEGQAEYQLPDPGSDVQ